MACTCRNIAAFEHALQVRVCGMLITMLQNLVDPRCDRSLQEHEMRVVLRVVRTVIWHFHGQLRSKCGIFVEALLAGNSFYTPALGSVSLPGSAVCCCAGISPFVRPTNSQDYIERSEESHLHQNLSVQWLRSAEQSGSIFHKQNLQG